MASCKKNNSARAGYLPPCSCEHPYHDMNDFVAVLGNFGMLTLPDEMRGAEPNWVPYEYDPNVTY